ncbi:Vacuolar membrane protease [Hyphodiscus hymeniophilus]|uniref:Peptide hydrolase n=1 Tax=Hyphodiscus hymeniophilus TaxID=353542 RepID=A0A9P7B0J0_9HELO|nr:Vacuolar membrane protease [Hyphodiscus hymeniophilus]
MPSTQHRESWRGSNPFSFKPMAVTLITAVVYLAVFIPLIIVHETVPSAPSNPTLYRGLNISEAWLDLTKLSTGYHPFNSRQNDDVRDWLLIRIEEILGDNGVRYTAQSGIHRKVVNGFDSNGLELSELEIQARLANPAATVFNDLAANYTSTALMTIGVSGRRAGISTYFEGNNIIVYIRGTEDEEGEWWNQAPYTPSTHGRGGVMVNAHFDSVSTGYGATDDGVGVITTLQLIKYFTTPGNTPRKGVVALFNNGEEDGLYGAQAFLSHPMASFVHTFLNLEGAGAGGRAILFRSTDTEVTRAYATAKNPFGTVVSADGFATGFVRSQTDYVVFRAEGYRGLDVAFWKPRSQYHTNEDDARHTSKDSLWNMLSASVETMKSLTSDSGNQFNEDSGDNSTTKVKNGHGSDGVWFDIFGEVFAVFSLRALFAWSLSLLIVSPLVLIVLTILLIRSQKYYFFSGSVRPDDEEGEYISLEGWRGAFRFPIILFISSALTVGAAFLIRKINPFIIYSSQYAVWAMSLSLFFASFWFMMAGCNFIRPSALHRGYALIWMFAFGWLTLVAATVGEDRFKISGGYIFAFYESAVFLATFIALCELFALPSKSEIIDEYQEEHDNRHGLDAVPHSDAIVSQQLDGEDQLDGESGHHVADATETTPLFSSRHRRAHGQRSFFGATFAKYRQNRALDDAEHRREHELEHEHDDALHRNHAFGHEQRWSWAMPTWTWLLQFLLICPFILVIVGQVGLLLVTATAQTGADGSPLLLPYLVVALFSILLILPMGPFMHRISTPLPTFLFLVFLGTLIYNLVAFPFSANNRYKAYFQQTVDLDSGINHVTLAGVEDYIREIITYIPSASGQAIDCTARPGIRDGLSFCSYEGTAPKVVNNIKDGIPPEKGMSDWLTYNVSRVEGQNKATFHVSGIETKACVIRWDEPFKAFHVHGAAYNEGKWSDVPATGSDQIKLWHRDWNREWIVDVEWPVSPGKQEGEEGRTGQVVCLWSDHNTPGTIPALDEAQKFSPKWTSVVKLTEALVEGSKAFVV